MISFILTGISINCITKRSDAIYSYECVQNTEQLWSKMNYLYKKIYVPVASAKYLFLAKIVLHHRLFHIPKCYASFL